MYVAAHGNEEQIGKAKKTVIWAIIGLVFAFLSYSSCDFRDRHTPRNPSGRL